MSAEAPTATARASAGVDPTDPALISSLQEVFDEDLDPRFDRLVDLVEETVATNDALGLGRDLSLLASPRDSFEGTADARQAAFIDWFERAVEDEFVVPVSETEVMDGQHYSSKYTRAAYGKGVEQAQNEAGAAGVTIPEGAVGATAIRGPVRNETLRQLYTRNYAAILKVSEDTGSEVGRVLAESYAKGRGPDETARALSDRIEKIGRHRARLVARTESLRAHADGTLDGYEELGVERVGAQVEHLTAGDERVCSECQELEGNTYSIREARGRLPIHPACRCAWIPAF